jgi:hypothetical protein|tara:strand:+ start:6730 stop:7518 length:789 start_codon:yes stop_codon:yes gene_type:complete
MKIAVCFCGNVGALYSNKKTYTIEGDIDYRIGYEHWKKHVFDINDVDVFIHNWSVEYADGLVDLYKPKKHLIEPQIEFGSKWTDPTGEIRKEFMVSRWYSFKESIRLKKEYEEENNMKYDLVVMSRVDWAWMVNIDFSLFEDTNLFYSPANPDFLKTHHLPRLDDWIFFSKSENMDKFSELYQKLYVDTDGIKNPNYKIDSHTDVYTHAYNCGFEIVMVENLRDGVEGTPVRALYDNCKYSEDYDFNKLKILPNGRWGSARF